MTYGGVYLSKTFDDRKMLLSKYAPLPSESLKSIKFGHLLIFFILFLRQREVEIPCKHHHLDGIKQSSYENILSYETNKYLWFAMAFMEYFEKRQETIDSSDLDWYFVSINK